MIHFGDVVDVDVLGSFEYDWRGTLTPEGYLDGMDKLSEQVYALCKSEAEVAANVAQGYSTVLRDPKVVVRILDRSNRAVTFLDGAVKFPQRFQIRRPVFLNELLIAGGGVTDTASGEVRIFRPRNASCAVPSDGSSVGKPDASKSAAGSDVISIQIADLIAGDQQANPPVLGGDIISVVEALPIYVTGAVNNPRQLSARNTTTLSRAVAAAGGVAKGGDRRRVSIYRREAGPVRSIEADLEKIEAGEADDPVLMAYDIVEVAQNGGRRRSAAPVIETSGIRPTKLLNLPLRIIE